MIIGFYRPVNLNLPVSDENCLINYENLTFDLTYG